MGEDRLVNLEVALKQARLRASLIATEATYKSV